MVHFRTSSQATYADGAYDMSRTNMIFIRLAGRGANEGCGITRRIGTLHNLSGASTLRVWPSVSGEPGVWAAHGALSEEDFGSNLANERVWEPDSLPSWEAVQALKLPVFMWTLIHDPATRAIGSYNFALKSSGEQSSSLSKIEFLSRYSDNQFRYIRPSAKYTLDEVFNTYGLIAVAERLDESLVVLAATLKVPLSDVLYLSHGSHNPTDEPDDVKHFLDNEFFNMNKLDYQLLERANAELTSKIIAMHLEPAVQTFKRFLAEVREDCKIPGEGTAPISKLTNCIVDDQGCNYECLNKFSKFGRKMCDWCE